MANNINDAVQYWTALVRTGERGHGQGQELTAQNTASVVTPSDNNKPCDSSSKLTSPQVTDDDLRSQQIFTGSAGSQRLSSSAAASSPVSSPVIVTSSPVNQSLNAIHSTAASHAVNSKTVTMPTSADDSKRSIPSHTKTRNSSENRNDLSYKERRSKPVGGEEGNVATDIDEHDAEDIDRELFHPSADDEEASRSLLQALIKRDQTLARRRRSSSASSIGSNTSSLLSSPLVSYNAGTLMQRLAGRERASDVLATCYVRGEAGDRRVIELSYVLVIIGMMLVARMFAGDAWMLVISGFLCARFYRFIPDKEFAWKTILGAGAVLALFLAVALARY